jgi:hypothetical protein
MSNNQQPAGRPGSYSYYRSTDGVDDVFFIEHEDGRCILKLHFWDEPDDHTKAAVAEAKAQIIVAALNIEGGGWVQPPYAHWIMHHDKEIAAVWFVQDVLDIRDDLTEDQAWQVLQRIDRDHDRDLGITKDVLRQTAEAMFPKKPNPRRKRLK